ncbi:hypothetical protein [Persicobacter sp. CCB-QB2]|uniref:hypothetical protein n=1 Tax=Persicobacter sp. CCB-QB2 TaxID=1561025 RepID=UPI0006A957CA|nr:hypothetical protein [Persicobacter sp. CCB-QB2]
MRAFKMIAVFFFLGLGSVAMASENNDAEKANRVVVSFNHQNKSLILKRGADCCPNTNATINLNRVDELAYKTKIYRYFGGILRTNALGFETIVVEEGGEQNILDFNRENIALVVNNLID